MVYLVAIAIGLVFGAGDQYLGTVHVTSRLGWWTITVSGMSAPWLIVPFLVGTTQDRARRAAALGLILTMSALLGYFAMSNSVFEGAPIDRFWPRTVAMVRSGANVLWIAGGAITAPLYAYFGHRWRVARSWIGALLVTCALCLEPLVRGIVGDRLDILVLNAGVSKAATIEETTVHDFDHLFAVNVRAPFFLVQQLLPILCSGSNVVILSSLGARPCCRPIRRPRAPSTRS